MTLLDVDNNPSTDVNEDDLISKGDASYESAWIDKLLGDSDEEGDDEADAGHGQEPSRHNSCQQEHSRQDYKKNFGTFFLHDFLFDFYSPYQPVFVDKSNVLFQILLRHLVRVPPWDQIVITFLLTV